MRSRFADPNTLCLSSSEQEPRVTIFQPLHGTFLSRNQSHGICLTVKSLKAQEVQYEMGVCPPTLFLNAYTNKNVYILKIRF